MTHIVMPGKHRLEAEENGRVIAVKEIDPTPGAKIAWMASWAHPTNGAAVATGVLALFTNWSNPFGRQERQLSVGATMGPKGGNLTISGTF